MESCWDKYNLIASKSLHKYKNVFENQKQLSIEN